jgi:hypothetical protein
MALPLEPLHQLKLLVVDKINGKVCIFYKLWNGELGHITQTSETTAGPPGLQLVSGWRSHTSLLVVAQGSTKHGYH